MKPNISNVFDQTLPETLTEYYKVDCYTVYLKSYFGFCCRQRKEREEKDLD